MLGSHPAMPRCCSQLTTQRELLKVLKILCVARDEVWPPPRYETCAPFFELAPWPASDLYLAVTDLSCFHGKQRCMTRGLPGEPRGLILGKLLWCGSYIHGRTLDTALVHCCILSRDSFQRDGARVHVSMPLPCSSTWN